MPMKRSGLLSLWVGGSSVIIWAFNRFQSQALELIQAYPWAVSAYVMLAAGFSFCFCYWFESNLKTPKFQKIICWILQCIGLGLIFISSFYQLLVSHNQHRNNHMFAYSRICYFLETPVRVKRHCSFW